MKARLSPITAEMSLSKTQKEIVRQFVNAEYDNKRVIWTRRQLLAMCLALNDIYGFGDKRLGFILQGIEDITTDYAGRAYTTSEARNTDVTIDNDKMADLMQEELLSRKGIHIVITA